MSILWQPGSWWLSFIFTNFVIVIFRKCFKLCHLLLPRIRHNHRHHCWQSDPPLHILLHFYVWTIWSQGSTDDWLDQEHHHQTHGSHCHHFWTHWFKQVNTLLWTPFSFSKIVTISSISVVPILRRLVWWRVITACLPMRPAPGGSAGRPAPGSSSTDSQSSTSSPRSPSSSSLTSSGSSSTLNDDECIFYQGEVDWQTRV